MPKIYVVYDRNHYLGLGPIPKPKPKLAYSHLSNKREVTFTGLEKFHPPQKKSPLHVYWFLRFFPPSTQRLLHLCTSFSKNLRKFQGDIVTLLKAH